VPLDEYVWLFTDHVYVSQADAVVVLLVEGVMVNTRISVLHPLTLL
jgi:hypothetical protein